MSRTNWGVFGLSIGGGGGLGGNSGSVSFVPAARTKSSAFYIC